jgi:hypothetical protein
VATEVAAVARTRPEVRRLWIAAAQRSNAPARFADPAVTPARGLTDTFAFAEIAPAAPADAPGFVAARFAAALAAPGGPPGHGTPIGGDPPSVRRGIGGRPLIRRR